jgi:hypothetical protein
MKRTIGTMLLAIFAGACGDQATPAQSEAPASTAPAPDAQTAAPVSAQGQPQSSAATDSSLQLKPLAPGYMRFETQPVVVPAGSSNEWAQWVGGPLDQDYDVLDITGVQSSGGHHALLYAGNEANPAGFTRVWKDVDQLTTRLMGGIGGEGGAKATLPPGVVFRVKKGSYLIVQSHYLNATDRELVGRAALDMKLTPVDPAHRVASIMANTNIEIRLTPRSESTMDVTCLIEKELQFIQIANHMHDYGTSTVTEFIDPAGQHHELKSDLSWSGEWALNPNFTAFPTDQPLVIPAGSTLHTACTWRNTTAEPVAFPAEMCVFFGFILNDSDIYCQGGKWSAMQGAPGTSNMADAAVDPPIVASDAGVPANGACLGANDRAIMSAAAFDQQSTDCATLCAVDPDIAGCTTQCLATSARLSPPCAACNGVNIACGAQHCLAQCVVDKAGEPCRTCVKANCDTEYHRCIGF